MAVDTVARALAIRAGTISLDYDPATKQMSFKDAQGNIVTIPLVDFIDIYVGGETKEIKTTVESGNVIKSTLIDSSVDMIKLSLTLQNTISGKLDTLTFNLEKKKLEDLINLKVDKVTGKQLSTNDFTNLEKDKLLKIEDGANKYIHPAGTNPHGTTKTDIGLGSVPNVLTDEQTPTFTQASARANIVSGETISTLFGKIMKWFSDLKSIAWSADYRDLSNVPTIPTTLPPNGAAGGDLSGNYPNPSVNDNSHLHTIENVTGLLAALDAKPVKSIVYDANISTSWGGSSVPYTQSLNINGATPTNIVEISPRINITEFQLKEMGALMLSDGGQTTNSITLKCFGKKNTGAIPITVIVRGDKD